MCVELLYPYSVFFTMITNTRWTVSIPNQLNHKNIVNFSSLLIETKKMIQIFSQTFKRFHNHFKHNHPRHHHYNTIVILTIYLVLSSWQLLSALLILKSPRWNYNRKTHCVIPTPAKRSTFLIEIKDSVVDYIPTL